jgi:hypothetical protein
MILAPAAAERNTKTAAEEWRESGVQELQEFRSCRISGNHSVCRKFALITVRLFALEKLSAPHPPSIPPLWPRDLCAMLFRFQSPPQPHAVPARRYDFPKEAPEFLTCLIPKRRLIFQCNTGDPGLEDVVDPESVGIHCIVSGSSLMARKLR